MYSSSTDGSSREKNSRTNGILCQSIILVIHGLAVFKSNQIDANLCSVGYMRSYLFDLFWTSIIVLISQIISTWIGGVGAISEKTGIMGLAAALLLLTCIGGIVASYVLAGKIWHDHPHDTIFVYSDYWHYTPTCPPNVDNYWISFVSGVTKFYTFILMLVPFILGCSGSMLGCGWLCSKC
jgi:hypothetical protein